MDGLTIGEVAKQANVHTETLRYYERRGLVPRPPRSVSNYRLYAEDTVRRVRFIKSAQELGFSLKEIRELLSLRAAPKTRCWEIRERAEAKIKDAEARALKPGILRLVDRVLLIYVPGVFAASALGFLLWTVGAWLWAGEPDALRASFAALSVLVMGYPCALGMATPLAIIRASGQGAARGILMRSGEAFHVFKDVTVIVLDKTGTLTEGQPAVVRCLAPGHEEHEVLRLAASAETLSEHPLAQAIVQEAEARGLALAKPEAFEAYPGRGVTAAVDGRQVVVGTPRFLEERRVDISPIRPALAQVQAQGQTAVLVAADRPALGRPGGGP